MKRYINELIIIAGIFLVTLFLDFGLNVSVDWKSVWMIEAVIVVLTFSDFAWKKFKSN